MTYEPFKFVVTPVLIDRDADGNVIAEAEGQPVQVYGVDKLKQYAAGFGAQVAAINAEREAAREADEAPAPNRATRRATARKPAAGVRKKPRSG